MEINDSDLRIERFSDGRGGQNQNKHPKNVRMTHVPTGIVATVRGRNYHKNVALAKKEIVLKLKEAAANKRAAEKKQKRDYAIHNTEVIRTYNYKRGTVKDHRTGKVASLKEVLDGKIDLLR